MDGRSAAGYRGPLSSLLLFSANPVPRPPSVQQQVAWPPLSWGARAFHSFSWNRWEREQPAPAATTCRCEGLGEQDGALGLPRLPKQPSPCLFYPMLLLLVLLLLLPLSQCETTKSNGWLLTEGQRRNKLFNIEWNPSLVRIFWAADGKLRRAPGVSRVPALWI